MDLVLHPAEEVVVGGIALEYAGGALLTPVIDDHIDGVPAEIGLAGRHLHDGDGRWSGLFGRRFEVVDLFENVLLDSVQVRPQRIVRRILGPDVLDQFV